MREFFKGWKRKLGCVTLVTACLLMGMWIRSQRIHDAYSFGFNHHQQAIISFDGRLTWWSYNLAWHESPYHHFGSEGVCFIRGHANRTVDPNDTRVVTAE